MHQPAIQSPNFGFLAEHGAHLLDFAGRAERYVLDDPNTTLIKLRQLAEELAELAAAYTNIHPEREDGFSDLLRKLKRKHIVSREIADIFHGIRKAGNAAAHEGAGTRQEAVGQLKLARRLAVWFHQAFRDPDFRPGPFVLPPTPPKVSKALKAELDQLRKARWDSERRADETEDALRKAVREQEAAEARAASMFAELEAALELAEETEARQAELMAAHRARVEALQAQAEAASSEEQDATRAQAQAATDRFDLTEGEARECIDAQLRARGWEADSIVRTWENGARPQAGRNQAIAFCPTGSDYADYVLFLGETVAAIIEAKRRNIDLRQALDDAASYSAGYEIQAEEVLPEASGAYRVPLLFASNGRPFVGEDDVLHGVWYRDVRSTTSGSAQERWPTPSELADLLRP